MKRCNIICVYNIALVTSCKIFRQLLWKIRKFFVATIGFVIGDNFTNSFRTLYVQNIVNSNKIFLEVIRNFKLCRLFLIFIFSLFNEKVQNVVLNRFFKKSLWSNMLVNIFIINIAVAGYENSFYIWLDFWISSARKIPLSSFRTMSIINKSIFPEWIIFRVSSLLIETNTSCLNLFLCISQCYLQLKNHHHKPICSYLIP